MSQPDTDDRFLEADEVASNLREYLDVLEVEREVIEAAADGLEDGTVAVSEMVEVLPDPMPLEAWERDAFDPEAAYVLGQAGPEDDGGE